MEDLVLLFDICEKYFGIKPRIARQKAAIGTLPVPAFRLGDARKGPLYVRKSDLDAHIEERAAKASKLNSQMRMIGAV